MRGRLNSFFYASNKRSQEIVKMISLNAFPKLFLLWEQICFDFRHECLALKMFQPPTHKYAPQMSALNTSALSEFLDFHSLLTPCEFLWTCYFKPKTGAGSSKKRFPNIHFTIYWRFSQTILRTNLLRFEQWTRWFQDGLQVSISSKSKLQIKTNLFSKFLGKWI